MKVSLVIPLYNKAAYVERCLGSVIAQGYEDLEIIVVDDGSSDGGDLLAERYPDPRIRVIRQPNGGPGSARNAGIAAARGELLAFLDADDEWLPGYLSESVALLEGHGPDCALVASSYFAEPGGVSATPLWRARGVRDGLFRLTPDTPAELAVALLAFQAPWSTVARTAVVRRWGGFFSRDRCLFGEDTHLWLKILLNETVAYSLRERVRFHTEASELSRNYRGAREVEPFLRHSEEIEAACPPALRPLLARVLAIRAHKTACMLGYWGRWREARAVRGRFTAPGAWRLPYWTPALVCATPVGAALGATLRMLRSGPMQRRAA